LGNHKNSDCRPDNSRSHPLSYFPAVFRQRPVNGAQFRKRGLLIVDEISYKLRDPQRGEVVVFKYPNDISQRYIKRIIGLPGETVAVENGKVEIFNKEGDKVLNESEYLSSYVFTPGSVRVTLGENEYFVLGDNRPSSSDSRRWGTLPREDIIGRVFLRAFPFASLAKIKIPIYE